MPEVISMNVLRCSEKVACLCHHQVDPTPVPSDLAALEPFEINFKRLPIVEEQLVRFSIFLDFQWALKGASYRIPGVGSFTTAKSFVFGETGKAEDVQDLGEVNMDDPTVLAAFLRNGMCKYPAQKYMLWMSGRGKGLRGRRRNQMQSGRSSLGFS